jgi:hypothetical protein
VPSADRFDLFVFESGAPVVLAEVAAIWCAAFATHVIKVFLALGLDAGLRRAGFPDE